MSQGQLPYPYVRGKWKSTLQPFPDGTEYRNLAEFNKYNPPPTFTVAGVAANTSTVVATTPTETEVPQSRSKTSSAGDAPESEVQFSAAGVACDSALESPSKFNPPTAATNDAGGTIAGPSVGTSASQRRSSNLQASEDTMARGTNGAASPVVVSRDEVDSGRASDAEEDDFVLL
ncbi:hypothetical protein IAT40_007527 [Kwoniella sp. CBS 6097]